MPALLLISNLQERTTSAGLTRIPDEACNLQETDAHPTRIHVPQVSKVCQRRHNHSLCMPKCIARACMGTCAGPHITRCAALCSTEAQAHPSTHQSPLPSPATIAIKHAGEQISAHQIIESSPTTTTPCREASRGQQLLLEPHIRVTPTLELEQACNGLPSRQHLQAHRGMPDKHTRTSVAPYKLLHMHASLDATNASCTLGHPNPQHDPKHKILQV